jgi:tetratricopeptide (TPR) repeat protein
MIHKNARIVKEDTVRCPMNNLTFWRERRASRCKAPRRSRCPSASSRSGNAADACPLPRPEGCGSQTRWLRYSLLTYRRGYGRRSCLAIASASQQQNASYSWDTTLVRFVLFTAFCLFVVLPLHAFQSIVVLPFNNETQKDELYWLGEAFSESLSEDLLIQDAYVIQRPERLAAYDVLHLPYSSDLSRATMLKIGEKLSADYLIFGSYSLKDTRLTVQAKVVKVSSARLSNEIQAWGPLNNLYQIHAALAGELKKYFTSERLKPIGPAVSGSGVPPGTPSVPLHAYELYIKGLLETHDNEKIQFFQRALEVLPSYTQAAYRLGQALNRMQRYKESNDALRKIQMSTPLRPRVDFLIGLNLFELHDFDAAYQQWYELSKTQPTAEVYNNIGVALLRKSDLQNSGWYLNQAVTLDPTSEDYRFNLAASYGARGYGVQATEQYRESLRFHPNDYQSLYFIAKLLQQQGSAISKNVMLSFQDALPGDVKGKFPEQYSSAIQLLRVAQADFSTEEKQYAILGRNKDLQQRTRYVKTYQSNARRYLEEGHPDQAITEIRKGMTFAPLDWYLHYLWGMALSHQSDMADAVAQLQYSLWCADTADTHLLLAEIYSDSQLFADAKLQIQKCLALDPKNKRALDLWGKIGNR